MAATNHLAPNYSCQQRTSAETDRRHLLSGSVAPSETSSIITDFAADGDRTPRAHSPAPSTDTQRRDERFRIPANSERRGTIADPTPQPYRGFPSEAHYLAALNAWADSKKYVEPTETSLYGFYGHTTMQELASRPGQDLGIKRKWRQRKEAKQLKKQEEQERIQSRRNTVT